MKTFSYCAASDDAIDFLLHPFVSYSQLERELQTSEKDFFILIITTVQYQQKALIASCDKILIGLSDQSDVQRKC